MPRVRAFPRELFFAVAALGTFAAPGLAAAQEDPGPIEDASTPVPFAYNYGDVETTRAAGMAGAMRAAGNGTTAPFLNPANLTLTRVYHIEAMAQITPETGRQVYGGAVVDSSNKVAGGVSIQGGFLDIGGIDRSFLDLRVAFAYAIGDSFHLGLGGRYLKLTEEGYGPLGKSKASGGLFDPSDSESRFAMWQAPTFDAGLTLRLADMINVGIVGQNLSFPGNALLPTMLGGGVAIATSDFTIEADAIADLHSYEDPTARVMVGGEYLAANHVPLRLGYRFDQGAGSHAISGGVGYTAAEFSIEASVRRTLVGPDSTALYFGIAYHLESSGLIKRTPTSGDGGF